MVFLLLCAGGEIPRRVKHFDGRRVPQREPGFIV
jgi:hypothetical protein